MIAANKLVDMLPDLVQAAAQGIEGAQLTVLNGSSGVNDVATGIAGQGLSIYHALRNAIGPAANGTVKKTQSHDVGGTAAGEQLLEPDASAGPRRKPSS